MDINKASQRLSELDLTIHMDDLEITVLWFRVMRNSEKWCISRHTHSSYEFHFVASGSCKVVLDDKEFIAQEGEFYLTSPGVYHEQQSVGSGKYTEYSINCDILRIDYSNSEAQSILDILDISGCNPVKDTYNALHYFNQALEEAYFKGTGYYNNIKNLAAIIITMAARALEGINTNRYEVPVKVKKYDYRFAQIEKYIEDNISTPITTGDLANYMYLSDKQLCRIIKDKTGKATKDFINSVRLHRAKMLLRETEFSVKEIADMLGFTSEYYFNQFFKREEGYPPGAFRANVRLY